MSRLIVQWWAVPSFSLFHGDPFLHSGFRSGFNNWGVLVTWFSDVPAPPPGSKEKCSKTLCFCSQACKPRCKSPRPVLQVSICSGPPKDHLRKFAAEGSANTDCPCSVVAQSWLEHSINNIAEQWHDCCQTYDELQQFFECWTQYSWHFLLQFQKLSNAVDL